MSAHASRTAVHADNSPASFAGSAFESIRAGAHELQVRAAEALPATSHFLGRVVYKTSYALAFGMTFPVMLIVRVVPKDNAIVHGLVDGAIAARDRVDEWRGETEGDDHDSGAELSLTAANGSARHHEDAPKQASPRRTKAKRSGTRKTTRTASRKKS
jgi:hypothetical protein